MNIILLSAVLVIGTVTCVLVVVRGRRPAAALDVWRPDDLGVTPTWAGDWKAYGTGYVNDALPGCAIVVTYYAVQYPEWEDDDEWGVERRVLWSVTRPGEAEPWWEDSETTLMNAAAFDYQGEADKEAKRWAYEDATEQGADLYGTWDGQPQ